MFRTISITVTAAILLILPLATSPAAAQLLVASDPGGDQLTLVDGPAATVAGSLPTGAGPFGLVVTPDGSLIAVANATSGEIEMIEVATGARSAISLGGAPSAVAVDPAGGRAFVVDTAGSTLAIIDLATRALVGSVAVGATPVAVAADGQRGYTADFADDTLTIVDAASGAVEATVNVGGFPAGVVADPSGGRVWVANYFDDTVSVVDPATASVVATVAVGADPRGIVLDAAGGRVYVASTTAGTVTVLDAASNTVLNTVGSGGINPISLVVSPGGERLYILHLASPELTVLDTATLAIVDTVALPVGHVALAGFANELPLAPSSVEIPTLGGWGMLLLAGLLAWVALRAIRRDRSRAGILGLALVLAGLLSSLAALQPAAAAPAPFQIQDGTFTNSDWEIFSANVGAGGSQSAVQASPGGNPDLFRSMTHSGDLVEVSHRFIGAGAAFDPATQGAITTVDFGWDRSILALDPGPQELEEAPAVFQSGQLYLASPVLFQPSALFVWEPLSVTGLTAADFLDGSGVNPDFSATGAAVTFGYLRRTTSLIGSGFWGHGIDNFGVTVNGGGGGGGDAGELRFESPTYVSVEGQAAMLTVQRVGGTAGAVSAVVTIPLGLGPVATVNVAWADGDGSDQIVTTPATGLVPFGGAIGSSEVTLGAVTGGARIHPTRGKTLLMVAPASGGPLVALALLLQLLLSASQPWWTAALLTAALYSLWRRRRSHSGSAAARPPIAP
jgi:YVTN family beta-propeller protein